MFSNQRAEYSGQDGGSARTRLGQADDRKPPLQMSGMDGGMEEFSLPAEIRAGGRRTFKGQKKSTPRLAMKQTGERAAVHSWGSSISSRPPRLCPSGLAGPRGDAAWVAGEAG
ncbi:hypothetical protein E4U41_006377 [Claviceps citrina]|nr:hypothetical protein E4U41_006377 [Claviceps citrina]